MTGPKKDNRGSMFPNVKSKATQPDFNGKAVVDGKEWQVAAWENTTKEGKKYWSLTFSVPLPASQNKPKSENSGSTNNSNPDPSNYNSSISDDLDDLDAILRSADDDNPFN